MAYKIDREKIAEAVYITMNEYTMVKNPEKPRTFTVDEVNYKLEGMAQEIMHKLDEYSVRQGDLREERIIKRVLNELKDMMEELDDE